MAGVDDTTDSIVSGRPGVPGSDSAEPAVPGAAVEAPEEPRQQDRHGGQAGKTQRCPGAFIEGFQTFVFTEDRATVVDTSIRVQTASAGGPSGKNLENFPLWNSHSSQAVPRFLIILLLIYFVTSRWWSVVMQGDSECLGVYGAHSTLLDT